MARSDAANAELQKLYPAGTFNSANVQQPVAAQTQSPSLATQPASVPSITSLSSRSSNDQFITGAKPGELPNSAQGGFTQGDKSYNVNPTSQAGISRVTAQGTSPLYTNINPEQAISGLNNQTIGQPADQEAQGIARIANANKIRGEMIANRDKDIPAGGYGPGILGDGGIAADNAEKTQRWRNDDLVAHANKGNQGAIAALMNADAHRDTAGISKEASMYGADRQSDSARYGANTAALREAGHDQVLMRGQDITGMNDAEKNKILAAQAKMPNYKDRYISLPNKKTYNEFGQVTGEEQGGVFDAATGQMLGAQQPATGKPQAAPKVGEVRAGFKFKGGNPSDKANWEKA